MSGRKKKRKEKLKLLFEENETKRKLIRLDIVESRNIYIFIFLLFTNEITRQYLHAPRLTHRVKFCIKF